MKKKTKQEYEYELMIKNPTVVLAGDYIDANTKTEHYCLIHKKYYMATPSRAISGCGCDICHKERISASKTKSHSDYIERLTKMNSYIVPIDEYKGAKKKIMHLCKKHDHKWMVAPNNILQGHGCPICLKEALSYKNSKSFEQYNKELKLLHPNIECIGQYKNVTTKVLHRCNIDGYEWMATPCLLLQTLGCPKCNDKIRKTTESYINEVQNINKDITVLGSYANSDTKILHKCNKCGHEWYAVPYSILAGTGCPKCRSSRGERSIANWLSDNGISYEHQKKFAGCRDKNELPFDFYLPDYNAVIEYDGYQHFEPVEFFGGIKGFNTRVKHDDIKTTYCHEHGIELLRIPYYKDINTELRNFYLFK